MEGIETARLSLEPLGVEHAAGMFALLGDDVIYEFIPDPRPASVDALRQRYRHLELRRSPDGRQVWLNWVVRLTDGGEVLGYVQATIEAGGLAHIAYLLGSRHWGQGLASEAVRAMVEHLRGVWSVTRLRATVDRGNARSIALLERLGLSRVAGPGGVEPRGGAVVGDVEYELALTRV